MLLYLELQRWNTLLLEKVALNKKFYKILMVVYQLHFPTSRWGILWLLTEHFTIAALVEVKQYKIFKPDIK